MRITSDLDEAWVAVHVRTHSEQSVAAYLTLQGHNCFAPWYVRPRSSNQRQVTRGGGEPKATALFPGYLFCRYQKMPQYRIVQAPGVIEIVGFGGTLAVVPEQEIESIRRVIDSGFYSEPWRFVQTGQAVRVSGGPLQGLEGILTTVRNKHRVVLSVTLLQRSVAVEVNAEHILPVCRMQSNFT